MDLLGFLKYRKEEPEECPHPFAYYDYPFRYLYCFGIGVMAIGNMKAITEVQPQYEQFINKMNLKESDKDKIIIDINNQFDYKMNEVWKVMDSREKRYVFLSDMIRLSSKTLWSQGYCEEVVDIFMKIFQLTKAERKFIESFTSSAIKENLTLAVKEYQEFTKKGYYIKYSILQYIYKGFTLEEIDTDIILEQGEVLIIDKPTKVYGDIIVKNGSTINFIGAKISIQGNIVVDSGRISIVNSHLFVIDNKEKSLITIKNAAIVKIEGSIVDLNQKCGMIVQEKGCLKINNSTIQDADNERAILFNGDMLEMNGVEVSYAKHGGVGIFGEAISQIDDCIFYSCEAENGGAIYVDSLYEATISNCVFRKCNAKYLGAAVYFPYKKYAQNVYGCEFYECMPKDSYLLNCFIEENSLEGE